MPYKKRQGLGKSVKVGRSCSRCRRSTRLVGLAAIRFEVPEIDSSGLVGLAVIGFEVPEIDLSGLVGLAVPGVRRFSSVPGAWSGIVLWVRVPSSRIVEDHTRWTQDGQDQVHLGPTWSVMVK